MKICQIRRWRMGSGLSPELLSPELRRRLTARIALFPAVCGYARWKPVLAEIDARHRVVMHLARPTAPASYFGPAGSLEKRLEVIRGVDPEAIVLRAMETRRFSAAR